MTYRQESAYECDAGFDGVHVEARDETAIVNLIKEFVATIDALVRIPR